MALIRTVEMWYRDFWSIAATGAILNTVAHQSSPVFEPVAVIAVVKIEPRKYQMISS